MTLKLSQLQVATNPEGQAGAALADEIEKQTDGQISVHVFPNGTLASSNNVALQQLATGALDMAVVGGWNALLTAGLPFDLAYAFDSFQQVRDCLAGPPGQTVLATADDKGVHVLGFWVIGAWRDLYGGKVINTPDDLKGVKVRTQGLKVLDEFYKKVGAFPQSIASQETYLALQTHQVDLIESSYQFCQQTKEYEVSKYGSSDHHGNSTLAVMVSKKLWDSLTPQNQAALQKAFDIGQPVHAANSDKTLSTIVSFLEGKGMKVNDVDRAPFVTLAKSQYDDLLTDPTQKKVLQQLQAMGAAGG
jgi:tripartite ATP-independent transporter DctP family solute receptor